MHPQYTLRTELTPADKFWEKVDCSGDCWVWLGAKNPRGYGVFGVTIPRKRNILAHRWAYEFTYGPIVPETLSVLHQCDNPACVRLDHLRLGTHKENMEEMRKRGRSLVGDKTTRANIQSDCNAEISIGRTVLQRRWHMAGTLVSS